MPKGDPTKRAPSPDLIDSVDILDLLRERARAAECQDSLREFVKDAWAQLSPGLPLAWNWHLDALIEHLEAMAKRQILRLIINISPRSLKSSVISVMFPAWRWLQAPGERFINASYSRSLALRDSRKTRALIKSPWYQGRWSPRFAMALDQDEKGRFENDHGGMRLAVSVEGGVTGEGASFAVYDDPNDLEKMQFSEYRQSVRDWYSNSATSRYNNPKTDARLCVQQRSPYGGDLTEYLLELGGWEHLVIQNEYTGRSPVSSIGWSDPRTHVGELMHPERLGPLETQRLKLDMRDRYAGQFQQTPATVGGDKLKREWFRFYNPHGVTTGPVRFVEGDRTVEIQPVEVPEAFEHVLQSWDMAFKAAEHNDYVAGHVWGRVAANCFLLAREHGHWDFPQTLQAVRRVSAVWPVPEKLVEDKANGPAVVQTLQNEIPGLIAVDPAGGKWARVNAISGYVEAGNVFLPNPDLYPWVWDLLSEFSQGVGAKHDDDTDAMSQGLKRLFDSIAQHGVPEFRVTPRLGEPRSAQHVERLVALPSWRRIIALAPGGAALWVRETSSGLLYVEREMSAEKLSAEDAGKAIARLTLPDLIQGLSRAVEILLPKEAFAPVEPQGSWAEMLENAILGFEPEGEDWDARKAAPEILRQARFRAEMIEEEDAALDRLRERMAFAPLDFAQVPYNRQKALALADVDMAKYADYMAAVEGQVRGEWPKLKISPACVALIAELGSFRRGEPPAHVRSLLLAVSAPRTIAQRAKVPEIKPWPAAQRSWQGGRRGGRLRLG